MTQAQQDAVTTAQKKFFDAEAAANTQQRLAEQAATDADAAKKARDFAAPAQAAAIVQAANDAYQAAIQNQIKVITTTQAAWAALGQAQKDLQDAITASLQTGAVEMMPPPVAQF
jgi:hypothetical protein